MNSIFLFCLIPNLLLLCFNYFINRNNIEIGSDHFFHSTLIDAIKKNGNKFIGKSPFILSENNLAYPQLFHWVLSFFSEAVYQKKYAYINLVIKVLEIIAFNLFLYYIYSKAPFDKIVFLYANIIVNLFPLSYASWNSKNIGLSARGVGLVLGQIYTYTIYIYATNNHNLWLFIFLFFNILIIITTSQMTLQYVLLSLPFFALFLNIPEIIPLPFIAFLCFYLIAPEIAKKFIIGQYNHKRNYFLFLAKIFILKSRHSIYRDFIYDFWIKLKDGFLKGLSYIYFNPLVEIIYGLPFLWFVVYDYFTLDTVGNREMVIIILAALAIFFLTSFRLTRFLGEPQRYLEFVIPFITIIFVTRFSLVNHLILIAFSLFILFAEKIVLRANIKLSKDYSGRTYLLRYFKNNSEYKNRICISNDHDFLKFLLPIGIKILKFDLTSYYKNEEEFNSYFYKSDYNILGYKTISEFITSDYSPDLMVINNKLYGFDELNKNVSFSIRFVHKIDVEEYSVYELRT